MTDILSQYAHTFSLLRKGATKFAPAPHKLILLLAVIREIEAGHIVQNQIAVTDALIEFFYNGNGRKNGSQTRRSQEKLFM